MASLKTRRVIGLAERPWAANRNFQRFLGVYELDRDLGVYFAAETSEAHRRIIGAAFERLPALIRSVCRQYQLTLSTCRGWTAAGNSSTHYADFRQGSRERISPHIEMGTTSLQPDFVLPHLTHEVCHLFWRDLRQSARDAYTAFLVRTCRPGTVEVTEYVQEKFRDYCRSLRIPDQEPYAENHRRCYRTDWVEESFCETAAVLLDSGYPSFDRGCTVDLEARRQAIADIMRLTIGGGARAEAAAPGAARLAPAFA